METIHCVSEKQNKKIENVCNKPHLRGTNYMRC